MNSALKMMIKMLTDTAEATIRRLVPASHTAGVKDRRRTGRAPRRVVVEILRRAALNAGVHGALDRVTQRRLQRALLRALAGDAGADLVAARAGRVLVRRARFGGIVAAVRDGAARVAVACVAAHGAAVGEPDCARVRRRSVNGERELRESAGCGGRGNAQHDWPFA